MQSLLIALSLLISSLLLHGNDKIIGTIISSTNDRPAETDISIKYAYDGKGVLTLTISNIEMNSATKGVTGTTTINRNKIHIKPVESYDKNGPHDSIRVYSVQYTLKQIKPGIYTFIHDDSDAEGQDRISKIKLDLSKAKKDTVQVIFKKPEPKDDPFEEPSKMKPNQMPNPKNSFTSGR